MNETFQEYSARMLSLSAGKDPLAVLDHPLERIGQEILTLVLGTGQDMVGAWKP